MNLVMPVPTEAQESRLLVAYLRVKRVPFTHIANETGKNARMQGIRNKQMGTSSGFPDYLCFPNNQIVAIEMKRQKGGTLSQAQKDWAVTLENSGVPTYVCRGFESAKQVIDKHLGGK